MLIRAEDALAVSEDALSSLENPNDNISASLLKCIRLARIIEDEENVEWLFHELRGYKTTPNGIPKPIYDIGALHGREFQDNKTHNKRIFVETASELENRVAMAKAEVGSFTTAGASVAGEWARSAMTDLTNHVTVANRDLITIVTDSERKLSILRSEYYKYALEVNMSLKFSNKASSIFDKYREKVDSGLADYVPESSKKLASIYSRLSENDKESLSQAATTCRKLLREFSDSLFKKIFPDNKSKIVKTSNGKELDVTGDHYLNRISASIDKLPKSEKDDKNMLLTIEWIKSVNDKICDGLHNDITLEEMASLVLHLYMVIADLMTRYEISNQKH